MTGRRRLLEGCVAAALTGCVGSGSSSPGQDDSTRGSPDCLVHLDRSACEGDRRCVWAESTAGDSRCLPNPPDCRFEGCPEDLSCAQASVACAPGCTQPELCCAPWYQCQHVDAGPFPE